MTGTLAGIFRALSDDTRLRILAVLRDGGLCVGDLVSVIGIHQPKVSRHLAYLKRVGLVRAIRTGRNIFYELAPPDPKVRAVLRAVPQAVLADGLAQQDRARLQARQARGGMICSPRPTRMRTADV
jgi:ArsR family transcriptional regulator, arsenate/arsenite/antimonite-responsive transcriptional repressor